MTIHFLNPLIPEGKTNNNVHPNPVGRRPTYRQAGQTGASVRVKKTDSGGKMCLVIHGVAAISLFFNVN